MKIVALTENQRKKMLYRLVIAEGKEDEEKEKDFMATKTITNPASATTDQQNDETVDVVNNKDNDSGQQQRYIPKKKQK